MEAVGSWPTDDGRAQECEYQNARHRKRDDHRLTLGNVRGQVLRVNGFFRDRFIPARNGNGTGRRGWYRFRNGDKMAERQDRVPDVLPVCYRFFGIVSIIVHHEIVFSIIAPRR